MKRGRAQCGGLEVGHVARPTQLRALEDELRSAAAPSTDVAAEGAGVGPAAGPTPDLETRFLDRLKTTSEMFRSNSNANTAPQPDAVRYAHTAALARALVLTDCRTFLSPPIIPASANKPSGP